MTRKTVTNSREATPILQPWQQTKWDGPVVEVRPADAGPEWPEGSVERVVFTKEAFPRCAFPDRLPYTEHFGADGWPLHTPNRVKSRLDVRCQAELRRYPWTCRPAHWSEECWVGEFSDHETFLQLNAQAQIIRAAFVTGLFPEPSARS